VQSRCCDWALEDLTRRGGKTDDTNNGMTANCHPNLFVAAAAKLFTVGCGDVFRCAVLADHE